MLGDTVVALAHASQNVADSKLLIKEQETIRAGLLQAVNAEDLQIKDLQLDLGDFERALTAATAGVQRCFDAMMVADDGLH